jgi:preprotein translocase subunit SecG
MTLILTALHIIVCFTLILVILLQAGRGQGLSSPSFGSGNVQSLLGTRAADFLTKATSVAAILFLLTCIGLNVIETRRSKSLLEVGRDQAAPVDIDAIKKALEKVKAEGAATTTDAAAKAAATRPVVPNPSTDPIIPGTNTAPTQEEVATSHSPIRVQDQGVKTAEKQ